MSLLNILFILNVVTVCGSSSTTAWSDSSTANTTEMAKSYWTQGDSDFKQSDKTMSFDDVSLNYTTIINTTKCIFSVYFGAIQTLLASVIPISMEMHGVWLTLTAVTL